MESNRGNVRSDNFCPEGEGQKRHASSSIAMLLVLAARSPFGRMDSMRITQRTAC